MSGGVFTLVMAHRVVNFKSGIATYESFHKACFREVPVVLHITCHGSQQTLKFEDEKGSFLDIDEKHLNDLVPANSDSNPNPNDRPSLVFLAACHSEILGNILARVIDHVVCCKTNEELKDDQASMFAASFYASLLVGKSVKQAFMAAKSRLSDKGHAESDKYLLLPAEGDHDAVLFSSLEIGEVIDWTPPPPPNNILMLKRSQMYVSPSIPQQLFLCIYFYMMCIVCEHSFPLVRCVTHVMMCDVCMDVGIRPLGLRSSRTVMRFSKVITLNNPI